MPETITISGSLLAPLRAALYSYLANDTDTLNEVLMRPSRERTSLVHTTFLQLCATGAMLDRIGWREQDSAQNLIVSSTQEARMIVEALTVELLIEDDRALDLRKLGTAEQAATARQRCQALNDALAAIGADAAAAGLLDPKPTSTPSPNDPSEH